MIRMLVLLHVMAGSVAVLGMLGAWLTTKGSKRHRLSGKVYVSGMCATLLLALLVSLVTYNIFLLLIAVFSGYFVYTGWRLAVTKNGTRNQLDRKVTVLMLSVSGLMVLYGFIMLLQSDNLGVALIIFGIFAFIPAWQDYQRSETWPTGKERIVLHLNRMGGASIATTTAVFVVNVQTSPAFIAWILPSVAGTALIVYWSRRWTQPATS